MNWAKARAGLDFLSILARNVYVITHHVDSFKPIPRRYPMGQDPYPVGVANLKPRPARHEVSDPGCAGSWCFPPAARASWSVIVIARLQRKLVGSVV